MIKKVLYWVVMAVLIGVFAFSGWKLLDIWMGQNEIANETQSYSRYLTQSDVTPDEDNPDAVFEEDPTAEASDSGPEYFNPDWTALLEANPNIVGWIIVPGTGISFPVVQGADNDYYLTRSYTGSSNRLGSIFLDADAQSDFSTDNNIVYGHSVDIGGMFTSLKDFANQTFFEEHSYFWMLTPQGNYKCEITVFYQGSDDASVYYTSFGDEASRAEILNQIQNESTYYRGVDPKSYGLSDTSQIHYITLSTCNLSFGFNSDQRYVLTALMVPYSGKIPVSEAA